MPSTFKHHGYDYPDDGPFARMMADVLPPPDPKYPDDLWDLFRDWAKQRRVSKSDMEALLEAHDRGDTNWVLGHRPSTLRDLDTVADKMRLNLRAAARVAARHLSAFDVARWPKWTVTLRTSFVSLRTHLDRWDDAVDGVTLSEAIQAPNFMRAAKPIIDGTRSAAVRLFQTKLVPILAQANYRWDGNVYHSWENGGRLTPVGGGSRVYLVEVQFGYRPEGPSLHELEQEMQRALP